MCGVHRLCGTSSQPVGGFNPATHRARHEPQQHRNAEGIHVRSYRLHLSRHCKCHLCYTQKKKEKNLRQSLISIFGMNGLKKLCSVNPFFSGPNYFGNSVQHNSDSHCERDEKGRNKVCANHFGIVTISASCLLRVVFPTVPFCVCSDHVKLAATTALLNSLEFTRANFEKEASGTFRTAHVCGGFVSALQWCRVKFWTTGDNDLFFIVVREAHHHASGLRSDAVFKHTSSGGGAAVPRQDHVTVLPVHGVLHGSSLICCEFVFVTQLENLLLGVSEEIERRWEPSLS